MSALIYSAMLPYRDAQRLAPSYLRLPSSLSARVSEIKDPIFNKLKGADNVIRFFSRMPEVRTLVVNSAETDLLEYAHSVVQELERCMAGTMSDFVRVTSKAGQAPLTIGIRDTELRWHVQIICSGARVEYQIKQLPGITSLLQEMDRAVSEWLSGVFPESKDGRQSSHVQLSIFGQPGSKERNSTAEELSSQMARRSLLALHKYLFRNLPTERYYLPASRSGIMQSHRVLTSVYMSTASLVGLRRMEVPTLSGIVGDFIGQLLTLETKRRRNVKSALPRLAGQLESDILHGRIMMKASADEYPEISYQAGLLEAPLVRLSSMIGELAPVVLYLRYLLAPGDHLIIEEPEAHLHPESQRLFGRILTEVSMGGIAVTVTRVAITCLPRSIT